jgi:hypothetical protein
MTPAQGKAGKDSNGKSRATGDSLTEAVESAWLAYGFKGETITGNPAPPVMHVVRDLG